MKLSAKARNVFFLFVIGLPILIYVAYFLNPTPPKRQAPAQPPVNTRLEDQNHPNG
jgi:hypothetical protein